jgi:hypothetical protein
VAKETYGGRGTDLNRRATKAEKKEQARLEREALQRKMAARRRNRLIAIVAGVTVVVVVVVLVAFAGGSSNTTDNGLPDPASLPGILQTDPPWSNNTAQLAGRMNALAMQPSAGALALHHHSDLLIYIDGQPVTVPQNVGIDAASQLLAPLHTHTDKGTMHIESTDASFRPVLGQFFDVWGVYFTPTCIGSRCATGGQQLRVYVDGEAFSGDPTTIPLQDQQVIVVTFGTEAQVPNPIPTTFTLDGAPAG